jgi:hypothetical protein
VHVAAQQRRVRVRVCMILVDTSPMTVLKTLCLGKSAGRDPSTVHNKDGEGGLMVVQYVCYHRGTSLT